MAPWWLLFVVALMLAVFVIARAARRTHDEMRTTIESFDEFREALSPGVAALQAGTRPLKAHLERGPQAPQR